jgi:hypothetical protein
MDQPIGVRPVQVCRRILRLECARGANVRIEKWVDVNSPTVGVLRPSAGSARDLPTDPSHYTNGRRMLEVSIRIMNIPLWQYAKHMTHRVILQHNRFADNVLLCRVGAKWLVHQRISTYDNATLLISCQGRARHACTGSPPHRRRTGPRRRAQSSCGGTTKTGSASPG